MSLAKSARIAFSLLSILSMTFIPGPVSASRLLPALTQTAAANRPQVSRPVAAALSPALRGQPAGQALRAPSGPARELPFGALPPRASRSAGAPNAAKSAAAQADSAPAGSLELNAMPGLLANFEGVDNISGVLPPDPNGDIGYNPANGEKYYVQWVNTQYKIWDVTNPASPVVLAGPTAGNFLWSNLNGSLCKTNNNGDPVVLFDNLSQRWLFSQFAYTEVNNVPTNGHQCVAVSQTADPTGAFYTYDFAWGQGQFNDYTKFGVWPDAYYATANQFANNAWAGAGVAALNKAKLLVGDPTAEMVYFNLFNVNANFGGILPATFTGLTPPPRGAPGLLAEVDVAATFGGSAALRLWQFHANWANPAASTLGQADQPDQVIPVADFNYLGCVQTGVRSCIPQPNTAQGLDSVGDRLMYRLNYRNFGDHQALVVNHTISVDASDRAGIRWYELRSPETGQAWSVYQQGTYAPADGLYRWMGSLAMDHTGNLALGYSVSSSAAYPSIHYTGRLVGDPLGALPQGEGDIVDGSGAQLSSFARWGDYSSMSIDPLDDCTFWYTQEYLTTTGTAPWQTRIAAFKYPTCTFQSTGSLSGQVTDFNTGFPVASALISLGLGLQTTTGAGGAYRIDGLTQGSYNLTASRYGYHPYTQNGIVITNGSNTTASFAMAPLLPATLSGVVRDGSSGGHAWPLYARVDAYSPDAVHPIATQTAFSDPLTGTYSLPLFQGTNYTVIAQALSPGYSSASSAISSANTQYTLSHDFALTTNSTCLAPGYAPNSAYFQNFEADDGGFIPSGANSSWSYGVPTSGPGLAHSGSMAWSTHNAQGAYNNNENSLLTSPAINLTSLSGSSFTVAWWQWLVTENGYDFASVDASKDGGATWTTLYGPTSGNVSLAWTQVQTPLDASYAVANFKLRFHLTSDASVTTPGWSVDDIQIWANCATLSGGLLVGAVADANTGLGLDGASVANLADPQIAALTGPLPGSPTPDGFFTLFSPTTGASSYQASEASQAGGYLADTRSLTIPAGGVALQNFSLAAPRLDAAPSVLQASAPQNRSATRYLTVRNTGSTPVAYSFKLFLGTAPLLPDEPNRPGRSWNGPYKSSSLPADRGDEEPELQGAPPGSLGATIDLSLPLPWGVIQPNPIAVSRAAGAFVNGLFYVIGGEDASGGPTGAVQVYDPTAHAWSELSAKMPSAYSNVCAAVIGSDIYLPGGYDGSLTSATLSIFHTTSQTWELGDALPAALSNVACASLGGKLYVFGGMDSLDSPTSSAYAYDPAQASGFRWASLPDAPLSGMFGAALPMPDGLIYYAGLYNGGDLNAVLAYNPVSGAWTTYPSLQTPRGGAGMWSNGATLYVGGGGYGAPLNSVEQYDTSQGAGGAWAPTNPMVQARALFAYATDPQGAFYAAGGWANAYLTNAERVRLPVPIPWLQPPPGGALDPGKSQAAAFTFSTSVLASGAQEGYLLVDGVTPYGGTPVKLIFQVGAYLTYAPFVFNR